MVGGLIASCVHLWCLTLNGYALQDIIHRSPVMLAVPVLYVLVGLFLGENRKRLARRAENLADKVRSLSEQLDSSEIKRTELERGHLEMEKRIAGQTDTLRGIYDNLAKLASAKNEAELWDMTVELLYHEMRAESCAIWKMSPPELLALNGATPDEIPPLARVAVRKKGIATAADWVPEPDRATPGAELAGVLVGDPVRPIVVVVSGMAFNRLNRNTGILFELMVERAGTVAQEIRNLDKLRKVTVDDPELGLSSENYLRNRIHEQTLLARRHGGDLTLIRCKFENDIQPRTLAERLSVIVACGIRAVARASDGIAFFPSDQAFVILLPGTNAEGGKVVIKKIVDNLSALQLRQPDDTPLLQLDWGLSQYDPQRGEAALYEQLFAPARAGGLAQ